MDVMRWEIDGWMKTSEREIERGCIICRICMASLGGFSRGNRVPIYIQFSATRLHDWDGICVWNLGVI